MNEQPKVQLMAVPGFLVLGLGLNSLIGPTNKIHPLLENTLLGWSLVGIGGVLGLFAVIKVFSILKSKD